MVIAVPLSPPDVALARKMAAKAELGGRSSILALNERAESLATDQFIGQLGTVALHRYWFGDLQRYVLGRYFQNLQPWMGDGGSDIPAANVDVKTSLMRRSQDPLTYHLWVREAERHAAWTYILGLVPKEFEIDRVVLLVGWASAEDLVQPQAGDDRWSLPARALRELPPIRYNYFNT